MKVKSKEFRCTICGKVVDALFRCQYCGKGVCEDCLTEEKGYGQTCIRCMEFMPRQINWETKEIDLEEEES